MTYCNANDMIVISRHDGKERAIVNVHDNFFGFDLPAQQAELDKLVRALNVAYEDGQHAVSK